MGADGVRHAVLEMVTATTHFQPAATRAHLPHPPRSCLALPADALLCCQSCRRDDCSIASLTPPLSLFHSMILFRVSFHQGGGCQPRAVAAGHTASRRTAARGSPPPQSRRGCRRRRRAGRHAGLPHSARALLAEGGPPTTTRYGVDTAPTRQPQRRYHDQGAGYLRGACAPAAGLAIARVCLPACLPGCLTIHQLMRSWTQAFTH